MLTPITKERVAQMILDKMRLEIIHLGIETKQKSDEDLAKYFKVPLDEVNVVRSLVDQLYVTEATHIQSQRYFDHSAPVQPKGLVGPPKVRE